MRWREVGIVNACIPFPTWHLRSGKWDSNENSCFLNILLCLFLKTLKILCSAFANKKSLQQLHTYRVVWKHSCYVLRMALKMFCCSLQKCTMAQHFSQSFPEPGRHVFTWLCKFINNWAPFVYYSVLLNCWLGIWNVKYVPQCGEEIWSLTRRGPLSFSCRHTCLVGCKL